MFARNEDRQFREMLPGVERKTLTYGEATLMAEFSLRKGAVIPVHNHPHEQIGYLVKGKIRFLSGSDSFEANPGDSWCITPNRDHSAEVLEDSLLVEVFSPVREEYLP